VVSGERRLMPLCRVLLRGRFSQKKIRIQEYLYRSFALEVALFFYIRELVFKKQSIFLRKNSAMI